MEMVTNYGTAAMYMHVLQREISWVDSALAFYATVV